MDVVIDVIKLVILLAWLAAIVAIVFVILRALWRHREGVIKVLAIGTLVIIVILYAGAEIMAVFLLLVGLFCALFIPGLILCLVFRRRIKTRWRSRQAATP